MTTDLTAKPLPEAEVYVMTVPGLTESFEQRAREMWQAKMPGKELLILGGGVTITPLSHLDAAWREAEAALSGELGNLAVAQFGDRYQARAYALGIAAPPILSRFTATPAAALESLAAILRGQEAR